jgi:hypothetical protein
MEFKFFMALWTVVWLFVLPLFHALNLSFTIWFGIEMAYFIGFCILNSEKKKVE